MVAHQHDLVRTEVPHQPLLLIILDGWGYSDNTQYNAIHNANKPVWDRLWENSPHMLISASGLDVGLPDGVMGNSEVGHENIGAGRIVDQELVRLNKLFSEKRLATNPVWHALVKRVKGTGGPPCASTRR